MADHWNTFKTTYHRGIIVFRQEDIFRTNPYKLISHFNHDESCSCFCEQLLKELIVALIEWSLIGDFPDQVVWYFPNAASNVFSWSLLTFSFIVTKITSLNLLLHPVCSLFGWLNILYTTVLEQQKLLRYVFGVFDWCHGAVFSLVTRNAFHFFFTAKYSEPIISSIPEKITPGSNGELTCETHGGYPKGDIRWFVNDNTDWTKSSKMEVKGAQDGLLHLSSKLPLLHGSIFSKYTCIVYNATGGKEAEAVFIPDPEVEGICCWAPHLTPLGPFTSILLHTIICHTAMSHSQLHGRSCFTWNFKQQGCHHGYISTPLSSIVQLRGT